MRYRFEQRNVGNLLFCRPYSLAKYYGLYAYSVAVTNELHKHFNTRFYAEYVHYMLCFMHIISLCIMCTNQALAAILIKQEAPAEGPRDALLVNSCYVSRGMGVTKISNSKSDLQRHSRALEMVPFDRPHTMSIATMFLSCTVTDRDIITYFPLISQNLKRSRDCEHFPFGGNLSCMHYYFCVSVSTQNSNCLALPIPKI